MRITIASALYSFRALAPWIAFSTKANTTTARAHHAPIMTGAKRPPAAFGRGLTARNSAQSKIAI
ncbi:hypothetical protein [Phenylobacterium sp.]|uniref:hypothetical protein n=1 Tax=Phenylobacterium sp. TaxID=1871053 RepID=UPI003568E2F2